MIRVSSSLYRGAMLSVMLSLAFVAGCKKKVPPPPPPPPAPAPAPARPTVSLQANPTSINPGDSTTLSWTSTDATQLTISPGVGAVTAQGSTKVNPSDSTTYTITASGPGGSADSSVRVTVAAPPPPPPPPPAGPTIDELFLKYVKDAFFDFNKADIRADARDALGQTAQFLRDHPEVKVTIEGHCDERGSEAYNLALGDARAKAAKDYLVQVGIATNQLAVVSYGKDKPICDEHDEACWQKNRRIHIVASAN